MNVVALPVREARTSVRRGLVRLMRTLLRPAKMEHFDGPLDSIVILAQEKLGDCILLTPLLRNLRRAFPAVRIHLVASVEAARFFRNDANVDVVHRLKPNYLAFALAMRRSRFDLLFNTKDHPSVTFLCLSALIPARHRVGIDYPLHRGYYNHLIGIDFHQGIAAKNCALLDYLGVDHGDEDCRPYLPKGEISDPVRRFASKIEGRGVLGVNLSAGDRTREWPASKWEELIRVLNRPAVILSMPARAADKRRIEDSLPFVVKSPPTRSIHDAAHIIRCVALLVTPDTSLVHVASCCNTPVVGLYRGDPVHHERFKPFLVPFRQVISPTGTVDDIPVEAVVEAAAGLLAALGTEGGRSLPSC